MRRRTYLVATGVSVSTLLAGCLSESVPGTGGGPGPDEPGGAESGDPGSDGGDGTEPSSVIDAYLAAADDGDVDGIDEVVHGASPLREELDEDELPFQFEGAGEASDTEIVVEDAAAEDVLDLEYASLQFEAADLEDAIGDSDAVLVDVELERSSPDRDTWVLVTEDGEWRVFWIGTDDEGPDDPREAFEDPVIDEENDVVDEIDWEFDQDGGGDGLVSDAEWAKVVLTDDPGMVVDAVRVESSVEGWETELYGDEPGAWAGSYANVALAPDGDQIVVSAVTDGTATVVHRERSNSIEPR